MLNGVTVKFGGDQAKLMENLSKSVTGSPKGVYSGKGQPKEDLLKSGKDFATVIPTGFLVLHKDLQELIKGGKGNKGGALGDIASMLPTMFAAAGAVAIAGMVVAGLFGSMSSKSSGHISELVDELNGRLTVDDLAKDPEVLAAQHEGVAMYVKSFFVAQAASAVITAAMGAVGSGAGKALSGMVNGLLGKETKSEAELHLKDLIDNIILQQKLEDWAPGGQFWDDALQKEVSIGIRAYLGVWFAAQAVSMTAETLGSAVGGAVANVFTGLFKGFGEKEPNVNSSDHLKAIIDAIIIGQNPEDWAPGGSFYDDALQTEVSIGIRAYLGIWFVAQAAQMTVETAGTAVGGAVAGVFKGLVSGFGAKLPDQAASDRLKEIVDAIITAQDPADWAKKATEDGALKTEVGIGIGTYLAVWFAAQAISMTAETVAEGAGETVGKAIIGVFKGLFGESETTAPGHLKKLIDSIILAQSPEDWAAEATDSNSSLYGEVKLGIQAYLGVWFAMQAMKLSVESVSSMVGSTVGSAIGGVFTGLFHALGVKSPLEAKINDILDAIILGLKPDDPGIAQSEEVLLGVKEGIAAYIKTYFQMMGAQAAASKASSSVASAVGDAAKKVWGWLTGNKEETSKKEDPLATLSTKLDSILVSVINEIDANKLNDDDYNAMVIDGITAFVSSYFSLFADSADENKKVVKDLIKADKSIGTSVLNMYKELFSSLSLTENLKDLQTKIASKATSSLVDTAEDIFKTESKQIKKNYESSLSYYQINSALESVSEAYLKAVKESLEKSFNINASSSINVDNKSANILNAITVIQGQLDQLSAFVNDIKGNQGVMAGLYAASIPDGSGPAENAYSSLAGNEER